MNEYQRTQQATVVTDVERNPHRTPKRLALFNADGTPFESGGGEIAEPVEEFHDLIFDDPNVDFGTHPCLLNWSNDYAAIRRRGSQIDLAGTTGLSTTNIQAVLSADPLIRLPASWWSSGVSGTDRYEAPGGYAMIPYTIFDADTNPTWYRDGAPPSFAEAPFRGMGWLYLSKTAGGVVGLRFKDGPGWVLDAVGELGNLGTWILMLPMYLTSMIALPDAS